MSRLRIFVAILSILAASPAVAAPAPEGLRPLKPLALRGTCRDAEEPIDPRLPVAMAAIGATSAYMRLFRWSQLEWAAELAAVDDVQETSWRRIAALADTLPDPALRDHHRACALTHLAIDPDRPDAAHVRRAVAELRRLGAAAGGPLRRALAEIWAHPDPAALEPFVQEGLRAAANDGMDKFDRAVIAVDLFRIGAEHDRPDLKRQALALAVEITRGSPALVREMEARLFAAEAAAQYHRLTEGGRAQWALTMGERWLAAYPKGQHIPSDYSYLLPLFGALRNILEGLIPDPESGRILAPAVVQRFTGAKLALADAVGKFGVPDSEHISRRVMRKTLARTAEMSSAGYRSGRILRAAGRLTCDSKINFYSTDMRFGSIESATYPSAVNWRWALAENISRELMIENTMQPARHCPHLHADAASRLLALIQQEMNRGSALATALPAIRSSNLPESEKNTLIATAEAQLAAPARLRDLAAELESGAADRIGNRIPDLTRLLVADVTSAVRIATSFARARMIIPVPEAVREIQQRLRPRELVLVAYPTFTGTVLIGVSRESVVVAENDLGSGEVDQRVAKIRNSLTRFTRDSSTPYDLASAKALHDATFGRVAAQAAAADHIIWVGFGGYAAIPPAILHDGRDFAVKRHSFSVLTSIEELVSLRERPPAPPLDSLRFVGIGGVDLDAGEVAAGPATLGSRPAGFVVQGSAAPLYRMPEFIRQADRAFGGGGTLLLGNKLATKERLLPEANKADVLLFGTHGYLAGENRDAGAEPVLLLAGKSPGERFLRARDITGMRLKPARLVVLAACNTAGPDGRPVAEALSGLVQAFRVAGAPTLIASHWAVLESSTADVLSSGLAAIGDGSSYAAALRQAMLNALGDRDDPVKRHPAFWGAYVVVGDGAAALRPKR